MSSHSRLSYLWTGANILLAEAPVASRSMASRLAQSTIRRDDGTDEMAPVARRLHCVACGALLSLGARVRLRRRSRSVRRPRRGVSGAPAPSSYVVRTCGQCAAANVSSGARRLDEDALQEWDAVRSGAKQKRAAGWQPGEVAPAVEKKDKLSEGHKSNKKRKREKGSTSLHGDDSKPSSESPANGSLAGSFLFKPL